MAELKSPPNANALEIEYSESISRSTRQRVENDRRAASTDAVAPGSAETLHLSQLFTSS